MCGIVGLHLADRVVARADIDAMNAAVMHRGPDGDGVFTDGCIGLGMRRLAIIDVDGGWQPIANETGRIQVVQNGEIYNYRELRKELTHLGHTFRTNSDTEVIVHSFEQWGGFAFANKLRGMFGIAVWDSDRRELWLVRDRLGIKPLFYSQSPRGFAFASEIKGLWASSIVKKELQPTALDEYLTYGSAGMSGSCVKHVQQLLPGHVLRMSVDGRVDTRRYWEFRFPERRLDLGEDEACEAVYEKLKESVRLHLVADVPVGAFLSGGVDSSAVVGMMAAEATKGFCTFSIGFEEGRFNELPYARAVARRWGSDHHERVVLPDALSIVERLITHFDEPFADASAIPTWYVAELAAERVKVVLTGDGGDELFGGYDRYARAVGRQPLDRIPLPVRKCGSQLSHWLPDSAWGKYFLAYASLDAAGRYVSEHCLFPSSLRQRLLRPDWHSERLGAPDPISRMIDAFRLHDSGDYLSNCMRFDTTRYLPMDILVKVDRMTMAHGLEARPPILDHEFVEFAASLPTHFKFRSPVDRKYVFRRAMRSLVPEGVAHRRKSGFSVPLQAWFAGPLSVMFQDTVLAQGRCHEYLHADTIRHLFRENQIQRRDHGLKLWAILMLELWLRHTHHPVSVAQSSTATVL